MCQAAPLPRCSNHAKADLVMLEREGDAIYDAQIKADEALNDEIYYARMNGFTNEQIDDADEEGLEKVKSLREESKTLRLAGKKNVLDSWEQELTIDATPKGKAELRTGETTGLSKVEIDSRKRRLENAKKLNDWHKKLRSMKDSENNKLLSNDSINKERTYFYGSEYKKAKEKYSDAALGAIANSAQLRKLQDKERHGTGGMSPNDVQKLHSEIFERQQKRHELHSTQILERAKINLLSKAFKNEIKIRRDAAEQTKATLAAAKSRQAKSHPTREESEQKWRREHPWSPRV